MVLVPLPCRSASPGEVGGGKGERGGWGEGERGGRGGEGGGMTQERGKV